MNPIATCSGSHLANIATGGSLLQNIAAGLRRGVARLLGPFNQPPSNGPRWLSVDQIRKMQRMRRETVIAAMESGELPYERRGRIRYARECDVIAWEQKRLIHGPDFSRLTIHRDLLKYL